MSDRKQLLIVEDQDEAALFVSQILQDNDYEYQVARNGVDALAAMRQNRPDLVLLDIMMPRKSGIHVFREMKSDPELKDVPIVMVTGTSQVTGVDLHTGVGEPKQDEGDIVVRRFGSVLGEKIKDLTPDGLIEKPINPTLLIKEIQGLLS
jgi:two-component system phosphate regulon response regulator PhoB